MKNRSRKAFTILLAAVMLTTLIAGCTKSNNNEPSASSDVSANPSASASSETSAMYYDLLDTVSDSSDLPDWTGKQLNLKVWYTHGTGDAKRPASDKDVVWPEIKRVTGVSFDKDGSFDNGGQDVKVKMGLLNAAKDWPDLAIVSDMGAFQDLIAAGKVYELTDAIAQYAPHVAKRFSTDIFPAITTKITNNHQDGDKIWAFPMMLGNPDGAIKAMDPDFVSPNPANGPQGYNWIWVRDDILKMLYPNAKTQAEIDALYVKQGKFTKEDIFDVPIKSSEDFIQFLYDVQNLINTQNLQENGQPLQVTYAFGGGDNWSLMTQLFNNIYRIPANNNYFSYYDKTTNSIQYTFQQDFFKQGIKQFNQLVRDRVMDPNSLLENNASHLEKLNNGQYVVPYLYDTPDAAILKAAGKTFQYRKLWIDAPVDFSRHIAPSGPNNANQGILVFKDKVKEEDLQQVIRFLDYMISDVGEKMYGWGPRSAGLFEEQDGKRIFKEKALEDAMVYNNQENGAALSYNLSNNRIGATSSFGNAWPYYPIYMWGAGPNAPLNNYDRVPNADDALGWFDPGNLPGNSQGEVSTQLAYDSFILQFVGTVPSTEGFWKNRDAFEKELTKTLAARDDAEFEAMWEAFQKLAVQQGATQESLQEMTNMFLEGNVGYLENIR